MERQRSPAIGRRTLIASAAAALAARGGAARAADTAPTRQILEADPGANAEIRPGADPTFRTLRQPSNSIAPRLPVGPAAPVANSPPALIHRADGTVAVVEPSKTHALTSSNPAAGAYAGFQIRWADDAESVDVRHLLAAEGSIRGDATADAFDLTPAVLNQFCANNALWPLRRDKAPVVLFGVRGVRIEQIPETWASSVRLSLVRPDHLGTCCALGVWSRAPGQPEALRVWPGSTVPNAHYMAEQAAKAEGVCNLAPTGLHRFVVGPHRAIHGAFREGTPYPPHRLPERTFDEPGLKTLMFTDAVTDHSRPELGQSVAVQSVGNDLHPAFSPGQGVAFSSAGCQVVVGSQGLDAHSQLEAAAGDWALFRTTAGLASPPGPQQDGLQYDYLLLNGREALLTSLATPAQTPLLQRLRFGAIDPPRGQSRGSPFGAVTVTRLQHALAAAARAPGPFRDRVARFADPDHIGADGKFFGDTMRLVLAWQAVPDGRADGVVDRAMLTALQVA